jgi:hypothetical protein
MLQFLREDVSSIILGVIRKLWDGLGMMVKKGIR